MKSSLSSDFANKFLSTFFYSGYFPFVPGTFASFIAALLFLSIESFYLRVFFAVNLLVLGVLISGRVEKLFGKKDPSCIVIDEAAGVFLSLLFVPLDIRYTSLAFILFRFFDAVKPYPADIIQRYKGSLGIIGDDVIAAIYTNIVFQAVFRLVSLRAW